MRAKDRQRERKRKIVGMVEEKKRLLAFRNAAGRHREIFHTRLKAVYVCVVTYPLSSRSPTSTPVCQRRPSVSFTRQQICLR